MKKLSFSVVIVIAALFSACHNNTNTQGKSSTDTLNISADTLNKHDVIDMHNSRNSIDPVGIYKGTIPCADCEGIKVEVQLEDSTCSIMQTYIGKPGMNATKGKWTWKNGDDIILKDAAGNIVFTTKVGRDVLIVLDNDGKEVTGSTANMYRLNKQSK